MTHKELLAKIDEKIESVESMSLIIAVSWRALRAVVELHKPEGKFHLIDGELKEYFDAETRCKECSKSPYTTAYPCPTIQAIEKELN
jgi:hypothetical protein